MQFSLKIKMSPGADWPSNSKIFSAGAKKKIRSGPPFDYRGGPRRIFAPAEKIFEFEGQSEPGDIIFEGFWTFWKFSKFGHFWTMFVILNGRFLSHVIFPGTLACLETLARTLWPTWLRNLPSQIVKVLSYSSSKVRKYQKCRTAFSTDLRTAPELLF